ncbi:MAG: hypothetical protein ACJ74O_18575 [Frankiaceae bacterium]
MELTIAQLTEDELDSVFGGLGHHAHCMKSLSAGSDCRLACCIQV